MGMLLLLLLLMTAAAAADDILLQTAHRTTAYTKHGNCRSRAEALIMMIYNGESDDEIPFVLHPPPPGLAPILLRSSSLHFL